MVYRYDKTPMSGKIDDYEECLLLHKVDETEWEPCWNKLVDEHHYLGFDSSFGGRVKYVVTLGHRIVGAVSFCSAVYQLGPRDAYIGWDGETRAAMLPRLVNNNRFLILPWVSIANLASRILSASLRQLRTDWEKQYGMAPCKVETFVDRGKYLGT
ncbi:MAG: DUF4338 domain-containing protein [Clostridiales bacterium]|jgi:hypothetical protein|nr:DUF4338 domain-containing protein [Clostridiales bacterium]